MSNLPTKDDIDAIDAEIEAALWVLGDLRARRKAMLLSGWDVEVGSVVRELKTGRIGTVDQVREPYGLDRDRPWVHVRLHRKDGTVGLSPAWFFREWELVR